MCKDGGPAKRDVGFPIQTVDGHVVVVSAEDYARLQGFQWRIGSNGYVYRVGGRLKGVPCLMHRIVLNAQQGQEIHHGPQGKLNNMRSNLTLTTPSEHQKHHRDTTIARNKARRIYAETGSCKRCGKPYTKDRDHRGRQTCCSKRCAILLAAKKSQEVRNAKR